MLSLDALILRLSSHRIAAFWSHVEKVPGGCWIWRGARVPGGYGTLLVGRVPGTRRTRMASSHRVALTLSRGRRLRKWALHHCHNRACVRPSRKHVYEGTRAQNTKDMLTARRQAIANRNGAAKLTARDVREIRERYAAGAETQSQLAREFGITQVHVSDLARRVSWKHLP